jgi:hypothetical protein
MKKELPMIFAFILTVFGFTLSIKAQMDTVNSRRTPAISRDMRYTEWQLKELEKNGRKLTPDQQKLAFQQIKDDYEKIQEANLLFIKHLKETDHPDTKFVAHSLNDIKKSAERLLLNLALPADEKEVTIASKEMALPTKIKILNGLIIHFIKNPMFAEVSVLETENARQARQDLELIIIYCDNLKKNMREFENANSGATSSKTQN